MSGQKEVLVLGGGMAGLTAAALLAKRGLAVTLVEKEDKVGGYVCGFSRHGFYFDATGAFLAACAPGGEFHQILAELGLTERLEFLAIPAIRNIYPDFTLDLDYRNPAAYVQAIMARFPLQEAALTRYIELTEQLGGEFVAFERAPWWRKLLLPITFPTLFRCARHSHGTILNRLFGEDKKIIQALSALPTTLPPSQLSYIFVAVMWAKVLKQGVFYPRGGMAALSEALASVVREHDGRILLESEVNEIRVANGRVAGVRLSSGKELTADWYVGGFSPYLAQRLMPIGQRLYAGMHNLNRFKVSPSALLYYVGLPAEALPENWPYFVSLHTGRDMEEEAEALAAGRLDRDLHIVITTPSLVDQELAPAGHHSLKVLVHAPAASLFGALHGSAEGLARLQEQVFGLIKKYSGLDLNTHALFVESATPATLIRYTFNEEGAMYGLDAACGQVGPQRPPNRTRLDNLLWVGHYTRPAHGIVGSAFSGSFAANIIEPRPAA